MGNRGIGDCPRPGRAEALRALSLSKRRRLSTDCTDWNKKRIISAISIICGLFSKNGVCGTRSMRVNAAYKHGRRSIKPDHWSWEPPRKNKVRSARSRNGDAHRLAQLTRYSSLRFTSSAIICGVSVPLYQFRLRRNTTSTTLFTSKSFFTFSAAFQ